MFKILTGPDVVLDSDYLDMGVVESGEFVAKSFKIFNNSDVSAAYQVDIQCLNLIVLSNILILQCFEHLKSKTQVCKGVGNNKW